MNHEANKRQLAGDYLLQLAQEDARLRASGQATTHDRQLELTEELASSMKSAVWPILEVFLESDPNAWEIARDAIAYLKMDLESEFCSDA